MLLDQASSLARHMDPQLIELDIIHVITVPGGGMPRPIEIGYASGAEREPGAVFSCIIHPADSWSVQLKKIEDSGLSISLESAASGIDPDLASHLLCGLAKQKTVYVLSDLERQALACLPLGDLEVATISEKWPALMPKEKEFAPPLGRAGPDAVWMYRTLRQMINGEKK